MPASVLALSAYVTPLLVLLPFVRPSLSNHVICSWSIGKEVPSHYNFTLLCPAGIRNATDEAAFYRCPSNWKLKEDVKVAEWGTLALEVLEWGESLLLRSPRPSIELIPPMPGTPCAGHGYGRDADGVCFGPHWGLCLGDATKGDCLYMSSADDCEHVPTKVLPQPVLNRCLPRFAPLPN